MANAARSICLAVAAALALASVASAQPYPSRPITVVLPFAAGGPTDTIARILAERMRVPLGQPLIIENVTGAAGTISIARVVRAAPDGYTLSLGPSNSHVFTGAIYNLSFNLLTDLQPIALLATNPSVIVSSNSVPARSLQELIAWVKANQDKVSAGSTGNGSATQLGSIVFQNQTGTKFPSVVYRGAAPAMQDLVAGQITLMFDQISNSVAQVRAGQIRAYAVMSPTRSPAAPDVPTVDEAGMPGFHLPIWHGLWAPKGTPADVVEKLSAAARESLADPAVKQRLAGIGQDAVPAEQQTPQGLASYHKLETEKWWPIIKAANIKAD